MYTYIHALRTGKCIYLNVKCVIELVVWASILLAQVVCWCLMLRGTPVTIAKLYVESTAMVNHAAAMYTDL